MLDCVIQRTSYTITTCRLLKNKVYREVTNVASRKGRQLQLSRHQTYQEGDECSLSKFTENESLEHSTNVDNLVEIELYNYEPAFEA